MAAMKLSRDLYTPAQKSACLFQFIKAGAAFHIKDVGESRHLENEALPLLVRLPMQCSPSYSQVSGFLQLWRCHGGFRALSPNHWPGYHLDGLESEPP